MKNRKLKEGYYTLTKNDNIALYGAATIGKLLFQSLGDKGYSVNGFFDKRADEIHLHCGLPVYAPEKYDMDKDEIVILLAVKNVFEHSRIAKRLLEEGYSKIIYRPYDALYGNGTIEEDALNGIYSKLTEKENMENDIVVPFPTENTKIELLEKGILRKDELVTAYVPITIIFTDKKEGIPQFPILFLKPHINFVKYLFGMDGGEKESYLEFCIEAANRVGDIKTTSKWKENVIANRAEVFWNMHHMYDIKPSFFVDKSIQVDWNPERKFFNLKSGKHRAIFLMTIGKNYLPVTMSKRDYHLYLENIDVHTVKKLLMEHYDKGLSIPVENPYFYDDSCCGGTFWFVFLRTVMNRFNYWFYQGYKVGIFDKICMMIELPDCGFIKRFFMRMGCKVITGSKQKPDGLEKAINSGFNDYFPMEMEYSESSHYDCIICTEEWLEEHVVNAGHVLVLSENSSRGNGKKIMTGLLNGIEKYLYSERQEIGC